MLSFFMFKIKSRILNTYLADFDEQTEELFSRLVKQMGRPFFRKINPHRYANIFTPAILHRYNYLWTHLHPKKVLRAHLASLNSCHLIGGGLSK